MKLKTFEAIVAKNGLAEAKTLLGDDKILDDAGAEVEIKTFEQPTPTNELTEATLTTAFTKALDAHAKANPVVVTGGEFRNDDTKSYGWKHDGSEQGKKYAFGNFCKAVHQASVKHSVDPRLNTKAAASTYANETSGADGGFVVPPDFKPLLLEVMEDEEPILGMTDQYTVSGNSITIPVDEVPVWDNTNGITASQTTEASAASQSKPVLRQVNMSLSKTTVFVPVTDELMEDAAFNIGDYTIRKGGAKLAFNIGEQIFRGNGVGQCLGILNSPSLITVAKDAYGAAGTVNLLYVQQLSAMLARLLPSAMKNAAWYVQNDVLPALFSMTLGNYPIYLPINEGAKYPGAVGTLLGRPLYVTQHANSLNAVGDIICGDFSKYSTAVKMSGPKVDSSIHFYFDQGITAFRIVQRVAGQPWLSTAIASRDGSNTLSHFTTLALRS